EEAERRVRILRVLRDEAKQAKDHVPQHTRAATRLRGLTSLDVGMRRHDLPHFKTRALRKPQPRNTFRIPRRGSQVVRQRSAKPLFAGSIPARASAVPRAFAPSFRRRADPSVNHQEGSMGINYTRVVTGGLAAG